MLANGKTIGLALSGGGFRATLFGLGSLWRLNDSGLLKQLDRISSVSGGSIAAGVLAHRWTRLTFDPMTGVATNFEDEIAKPLLAFCSETTDIWAGLKGILNPFRSASDYLAKRYRKALVGGTTLKDLPVAGPGVPVFTFYATNMQTGRSFRLRQDIVADYKLGSNSQVKVELAVAVAASSGFPPVFSPIILKTDPKDWKGGMGLPDHDELCRRIVLADGGVYDNMWLQTLLSNVDVILVSDAGAPFGTKVSPGGDYFRQLGRVRDILIDQTRALRKSGLIEDFKAGRRLGGYWGIGTSIGDYKASTSLATDGPITRALEAVPTRLAATPPLRQGQLVNWAYALCDAALLTRAAMPSSRPLILPMKDAPLQ
jgi:NTE family protein